jgi:hypothetical protein
MGTVRNLDGVTADFAVFDVALTRNAQIEEHGNPLPAVRARKEVFFQHWWNHCMDTARFSLPHV